MVAGHGDQMQRPPHGIALAHRPALDADSPQAGKMVLPDFALDAGGPHKAHDESAAATLKAKEAHGAFSPF
jgi:hypothetical protein